MNNFEQATKIKLRFSSLQMSGLSVEDLWDLPLTSKTRSSLDGVAKVANKEIKDAEEESFVVAKSTANTVSQLKLDIVKHIIAVKLAEKEAAVNASANKAKREKIMSIIAEKEDESLAGLSVEDLKKML